jgi:hypothetical protein
MPARKKIKPLRGRQRRRGNCIRHRRAWLDRPRPRSPRAGGEVSGFCTLLPSHAESRGQAGISFICSSAARPSSP